MAVVRGLGSLSVNANSWPLRRLNASLTPTGIQRVANVRVWLKLSSSMPINRHRPLVALSIVVLSRSAEGNLFRHLFFSTRNWQLPLPSLFSVL